MPEMIKALNSSYAFFSQQLPQICAPFRTNSHGIVQQNLPLLAAQGDAEGPDIAAAIECP
jgi:hypothetical protein